MAASSLAKITSLSTQTLSLLLERQRFQTLPSFNSGNSSIHIPQITRNLGQLRIGILDLEDKNGRSEAVTLLRGQYERMRSMVGTDADIPSLSPPEVPIPSSSSSIPTPPSNPFTPYTDDPDGDPGIMLQAQRDMMEEQDQRLDTLSHSISRQHHISLQINDELETHTGLLQELDSEMDRTESRLTGARRRLDKVAQGAKKNGSTVMIGALILVLLILIIVFKT
ncbi:syntaxin-like protein [Mycena floridula]|nr:syntaxin-like protein [Mycena floridula]